MIWCNPFKAIFDLYCHAYFNVLFFMFCVFSMFFKIKIVSLNSHNKGHMSSNNFGAMGTLNGMSRDIYRECPGNVLCLQMCLQFFETTGDTIANKQWVKYWYYWHTLLDKIWAINQNLKHFGLLTQSFWWKRPIIDYGKTVFIWTWEVWCILFIIQST